MSRTRHTATIWHPEPRPGRVRSLSWEYPDGHRVPSHAHTWHQLLYAVRGVMTLSAAGGSWIVPAHRGAWVPAGIEHAIRMSGAVSMRTLYIDPRVAPDLPRACHTVDVPPLLRELVLDVVGRGSLDRRVSRERHILDVLLDQMRGIRPGGVHLPEPRDARARRVADLLEGDPSDRRTLAALARGSGASARTLQRLFRSETGMTFAGWRQQLRLGRALQRLAAGGSVTSVALDTGYASVSAFVSIFRRTFGQTPGRYVRQVDAGRPGVGREDRRREAFRNEPA